MQAIKEVKRFENKNVTFRQFHVLFMVWTKVVVMVSDLGMNSSGYSTVTPSKPF